MALEIRTLEIEFQLGQGSFGESGFNTVTLKGHRASATITYGGGQFLQSLHLTIYGMTISKMNELVTVGTLPSQTRRNRVTVRAKSGDGTPSLVFVGNIDTAWVNANSAPDVPLVVTAFSGGEARMRPVDPTVFSGVTPVSTVMATIAAKMGYAFQDSGTTAALQDPHYEGDAVSQAQRVAADSGVGYSVENDTVTIWDAASYRPGLVAEVSAETGMVGYPSYTQAGIAVTTLFNPGVLFMGAIRVKSKILPTVAHSVAMPVDGVWQVYGINHVLEAETPGGKWFSYLKCWNQNLGVPPIG